MFRLITQIIVLVFLLIPHYSSATVEIDEPDWKDMVGNWYLNSSEDISAYTLTGSDELLGNNDILWEHSPQGKISSVAPVKYAPLATMKHSQQNSQIHESLILFFFGMGIIGMIRISKKRRTIFTKKYHQLIAEISYKT